MFAKRVLLAAAGTAAKATRADCRRINSIIVSMRAVICVERASISLPSGCGCNKTERSLSRATSLLTWCARHYRGAWLYTFYLEARQVRYASAKCPRSIGGRNAVRNLCRNLITCPSRRIAGCMPYLAQCTLCRTVYAFADLNKSLNLSDSLAGLTQNVFGKHSLCAGSRDRKDSEHSTHTRTMFPAGFPETSARHNSIVLRA